jgi:hypothetical protein
MSRENLVVCRSFTALWCKVAEERVRGVDGLQWACQSFYESCDCQVSVSFTVNAKNII